MRPAVLLRSDRTRGAIYWAAVGLLAAGLAVGMGVLWGLLILIILEAM